MLSLILVGLVAGAPPQVATCSTALGAIASEASALEAQSRCDPGPPPRDSLWSPGAERAECRVFLENARDLAGARARMFHNPRPGDAVIAGGMLRAVRVQEAACLTPAPARPLPPKNGAPRLWD